jgi:hypothetical protein
VFNGEIINKIIKITDIPRQIQTFCVVFENSKIIKVVLDEDIVKI